MVLNPTPNPIGQVQPVSIIQELIIRLRNQWDVEVPPVNTPWWKFWAQRCSIHLATLFLLNCLDDLIIGIDKELIIGADKKATVLDAINNLYDYTIKEILPIWARPIAGPIKTYIIYTLMSNTIDFMVAKYHSAVWLKST